MAHRGDAGRRQIIGMNVIGEYIIAVNQRRQAFLQAFERQAIGRVNAGRTQNGNAHTLPGTPGAQTVFGINPAQCTRVIRIQRPRFVDKGAGTIPVNPCRAYVNQPAW